MTQPRVHAPSASAVPERCRRLGRDLAVEVVPAARLAEVDERRRQEHMLLREEIRAHAAVRHERDALEFERDELGDELAEERRAAAAARADLARAREALEEIASESGGHGLGAIAREALAAINGPGRNGRNEKGAIGTAGDEREALRDLAGRAARHLRTLPEQTEGRDVALAAELERAAAGSLAASPSPTAGEGRPPRDGRALVAILRRLGLVLERDPEADSFPDWHFIGNRVFEEVAAEQFAAALSPTGGRTDVTAKPEAMTAPECGGLTPGALQEDER